MADLANVNIADAPFTWRTIQAIANTEMVPRSLRGNPEAMLAAVLMGKELGLGPMQSMNMLDVIDGKPSLSAELMNARIRQAGHSLTATELSDKACTLLGRRGDNGDEMTYTFTDAMASRAGLTGKSNWKKYPEAMLWARAVSQLARMLFPDVFAAMHAYTADELGSDVDAPTVNASTVDEVEPIGAVVVELPQSWEDKARAVARASADDEDTANSLFTEAILKAGYTLDIDVDEEAHDKIVLAMQELTHPPQLDIVNQPKCPICRRTAFDNRSRNAKVKAEGGVPKLPDFSCGGASCKWSSFDDAPVVWTNPEGGDE